MRARLLSSLATSENAAVLPVVALSLFALIGIGGLAFDYSRMATLDSELQAAADQAALAAATQLDGKDEARTRAAFAARNLIVNQTAFANERTNNPGANVTIPTVNFYSVYDSDNPTNNVAATTDADAHFVQVTTANRTAFFALTPVVAAFNSGNLSGSAVAGLHSAVCKVPPLMICNPKPGESFNAAGKRGWGVQVVAHQGGQSWAPGNFGYLDVGASNNGAPDLLAAMAYQNPALNCSEIGSADVDPGNTAPAIDAANTRFDIYNFGGGSGSTLGACFSGACPAAANVTKDLVRPNGASGNNACKLHNQGWQLPANQFSPRAWTAADYPANTNTAPPWVTFDADGEDAMGLPRDNCHYVSYGKACGNDSNNRFGNGYWARKDYFDKYHSGNMPGNASTITRYETYLWEMRNGQIPTNADAGGGLRQQGTPVCTSGTLSSDRDRRVFSVAIVNNCASLNGGSTSATVGEWVDMFFVEPAFARGNGSTGEQIYLEVIGTTKASGNESVGAQVVRRDVPYLIE
jgi:Flp pilus assembly protein TadG